MKQLEQLQEQVEALASRFEALQLGAEVDPDQLLDKHQAGALIGRTAEAIRAASKPSARGHRLPRVIAADGVIRYRRADLLAFAGLRGRRTTQGGS